MAETKELNYFDLGNRFYYHFAFSSLCLSLFLSVSSSPSLFFSVFTSRPHIWHAPTHK